MLTPSCIGNVDPVSSIWPPSDFGLVVEELAPAARGGLPVQHFSIAADGICLFARATARVGDARFQLPVFADICVYQLESVNTRQLARRLFHRRIGDLAPVQGNERDAGGPALRIEHQAFGKRTTLAASGQIEGDVVGCLHTINAYLPPGQKFALPGLSGDGEPSVLVGIPHPVDDAFDALRFMEVVFATRPGDRRMALMCYALACHLGDRVRAEKMLERWVEIGGVGAGAEAPFSDPPSLTEEVLRGLLPAPDSVPAEPVMPPMAPPR